MSGRLSGKRCLLTGAAAGIGRATALAFAREGAVVLATDISDEGLSRLMSEEPRIAARRLDITSPAEIDTLFAQEEAFDVLFNCAGCVLGGSLLECDEEDWRLSFQLNVDGTYRMCRGALPAMLERGGGAIINIASVASSITSVPNRVAYCASKAAVIGLTKSIAFDYAPRGIRCNAICPGTILTSSLRERIAARPGKWEDNLAPFVNRQPMGRLGTPDEVASLAVYLASDEAAFTTGQTLVLDGGWTI
jgi:2-keto-3-deoxy-L-fuconate dehydrogenase